MAYQVDWPLPASDLALDAPTPPLRNDRISTSISQSGECDVKKDLIGSDFVDCMVALP